MSSKSNQEILTTLDRGEYLATTIRTQKPETTVALDGIFGMLPPRAGQAEGPRQFNWDQAQEDNIDLIDDGILATQEASKAHRGTKILVSEEFRNRGKFAKVLSNHHRSMQQIIKGSCGEEGLKLVGLDVPPVRPKLGVREQYGLVHRLMRNPSLPGKLAEFAQSHSGGSPPDVPGFLSVMDANILAFEAAQASLNEAKKLRDIAYATKQAALQRLDNPSGGSEADPGPQGSGEGSEPATEPGTEPFCLGFFDRCEDLALAIQPEAFELSRAAVEMACHHAREGGEGGPCIEYRAHGVLSHAYIARAEPFWAGHTLDSYRLRALGCCNRCRGEFLLREGDLLGEERDAAGSLEALGHSLEACFQDLLKEALKVLKYRPEEAFVEIDGLRKSFIAPVPSRLAERLLSQDG